MSEKNIRITNDAHTKMVAHCEKNITKMGKFASIAIVEKIEKDLYVKKSGSTSR